MHPTLRKYLRTKRGKTTPTEVVARLKAGLAIEPLCSLCRDVPGTDLHGFRLLVERAHYRSIFGENSPEVLRVRAERYEWVRAVKERDAHGA